MYLLLCNRTNKKKKRKTEYRRGKDNVKIKIILHLN